VGSAEPSPTAIDSRLRRLALLVAGCFFMENLDATIVVTAIPRISDALGTSAASAALVISGYLVTLAALIPLSGWVTARFGAPRVFPAAIVVFTLASLGCALSSSLGMLVGFRILQAAGGAMMVPVGRIVVFSDAPKLHVMRLIAYIVWPGLIAPVVAPLAGGIITTYAGWRWLFLVNVPLGAIAFLAALRLVPGGPEPHTPPLDRRGVALTCGGLAALMYCAHLLSAQHPDWPLAIPLAVAAAVLLVAAARHLLTFPAPLLNLRTLKIPTLGAAIGGSALFWVVVGAIPFLLPLLFQTVFGWSAIKSGAVVLFLFAGNIAIKPATTFLYTRFGFRTMLLAATASLGATSVALGSLQAGTPLAAIAALVLLSGVARSVGLTGYTALGLSDVPPEHMRDANALAVTVQQLFSGLGVAAATLALRLGDLVSGETADALAYTVAFSALAMVAFAATAEALRLHPAAGEAVIESRRAS
jgi:EmrB/QacA subfamily drug resistance transporter